jgi:hypothetical protein
MRQIDDGPQHGHLIGSPRRAAHEGLVDLQFVRRQLAQLRER